MQPDGTFQLIEALGTCQVGTVWSAVDAQGRSLTVAMLEAAVAADQRWRDAFAAAANSLLQGGAGAPRVLYADFSTATPWVACAAGDGPGAEQVFLALGQEYRPAGPTRADSNGAGPAGDAAAEDKSFLHWPTVGLQPVAPPPPPVPSQTTPVSPAPQASPPLFPPPSSDSAESPQPTSGGTTPVSGAPQSPAGSPHSPAAGSPSVADTPPWPAAGPQPPGIDPPQQPPPLYYPDYPPLRSGELDEPRHRTGLWIAVAVGVVVALAAGAGVYAWQAGGGDPTVTASSSPQPLPDAVPTSAPLNPGVEPPKDGEWPTQWPKFKDTDRLRTLDLEGVGFPVKIPLNWQCSAAGRAQGYAKYTCGESSGTGPATGGELILRDCPQPCGDQEQTEMRQAEEAWGLQWIRVGQSAYFAESSNLEIDGQERYGLIVVAFWRSGEEGEIDKEVVFRATSPVGGAGLLRRIANYIRDAAVF